MATLEDIIAKYESAAEQAKAATAKREAEVTSIYDEIIARYGPAGTYGRAAEALLERAGEKAVGLGTQQLISSGLYGTQMGGGLRTAWESEVGAPARLQIEDIKMERLSQAQLGKAGFVERIEDAYPDYGSLMQYAAQAANVPSGGGGGVGGESTQRRTFTQPSITRTSFSGPTWAEGLESLEDWKKRTSGDGTTTGGYETTTPRGETWPAGTPIAGYGGYGTTTTTPSTSAYGGYEDIINKILGKVEIPKGQAKVVVGRNPDGSYIYGYRGGGNV